MKIRTLALTFSSVLSFGFQAFAQEGNLAMPMQPKKAALSNVLIAPVLGYQSTTFAGVEGINGFSIKNRESFAGGVSLLLGKGFWQLESGLMYSQVSAEVSGSPTYTTFGKSIYTSSYIDIPLLARWTFYGNPRMRLFLSFGAVAGILLDAENSFTTSGYVTSRRNGVSTVLPVNASGSEDTTSNYNAINAKAALGLGGSYRLTPQISLGTSVDYQEGVTNLMTEKASGDLDIRSRSFGLNFFLGYRI